MRGPLRWSAGRRRPYVTGAARPGRRARWLARDARAGPFAKDLPREPRKLPWGLANPWRLPALHHPRFGGGRKRETARPRRKEQGQRSIGFFHCERAAAVADLCQNPYVTLRCPRACAGLEG